MALDPSKRRYRMKFAILPALLVVILIAPAALPGQTAAAGATAKGIPITYSTAPLPAVYEHFIRQVVGLEAHGDRLAARGKTPVQTRAYFRDVTGLGEADYQFFLAAARNCTGRLNSARQELKAISERSKGQPAVTIDQATRVRMSELWVVRRDAALDVMIAMRKHLGTRRFNELDQRIRQHIVPNLRGLTVGAMPPTTREVK